MKKITSILTMVLLAAFSLTLTSCEQDDDDIAIILDGVWVGQVASEYFTYRYGSDMQYTDVMFEFWHDSNDYARGKGREMDYYGNMYEVIYFDYEVHDHVIFLYYSDGTRIAIRNYELYGNVFRGDFIDAYNWQWLASFDLERDYNGWDNRYYMVKKGQVEPEAMDNDSIK